MCNTEGGVASESVLRTAQKVWLRGGGQDPAVFIAEPCGYPQHEPAGQEERLALKHSLLNKLIYSTGPEQYMHLEHGANLLNFGQYEIKMDLITLLNKPRFHVPLEVKKDPIGAAIKSLKKSTNQDK